MLYQIVQAAFWLALSTWFGSAAFVVIAATAVFRTVQQENPILPRVLAVNLDGQHGTLLGSAIMTAVIRAIGPVQIVCAAVVLVCLGLHFGLADVEGQNAVAGTVRIALALAAAGTLAYDRFLLLPRIVRSRQTYIDHADEPETANPAKDAFDADQRHSLTVLMVGTCLLAGLILFSSSITPARGSRLVSVPAAGQ